MKILRTPITDDSEVLHEEFETAGDIYVRYCVYIPREDRMTCVIADHITFSEYEDPNYKESARQYYNKLVEKYK